jgi:hypothetical protein
MPGNIRKNQAMSLVTLRHRVTMSGILVPDFGKAQRDLVAGVPGGDVDEVAADGGAACFVVGEAGQRPGVAQQVIRDGSAGQPGALARKIPDGRCASGPSLQSTKTCCTIVWSRCCSSAWTSPTGNQ